MSEIRLSISAEEFETRRHLSRDEQIHRILYQRGIQLGLSHEEADQAARESVERGPIEGYKPPLFDPPV